jgi:hypothetical protein
MKPLRLHPRVYDDIDEALRPFTVPDRKVKVKGIAKVEGQKGIVKGSEV